MASSLASGLAFRGLVSTGCSQDSLNPQSRRVLEMFRFLSVVVHMGKLRPREGTCWSPSRSTAWSHTVCTATPVGLSSERGATTCLQPSERRAHSRRGFLGQRRLSVPPWRARRRAWGWRAGSARSRQGGWVEQPKLHFPDLPTEKHGENLLKSDSLKKRGGDFF